MATGSLPGLLAELREILPRLDAFARQSTKMACHPKPKAQGGGWGGIRTHETRKRLPVFKTGAFNRSATHPGSPAPYLMRRRLRVHRLAAAIVATHRHLRTIIFVQDCFNSFDGRYCQ